MAVKSNHVTGDLCDPDVLADLLLHLQAGVGFDLTIDLDEYLLQDLLLPVIQRASLFRGMTIAIANRMLLGYDALLWYGVVPIAQDCFAAYRSDNRLLDFVPSIKKRRHRDAEHSGYLGGVMTFKIELENSLTIAGQLLASLLEDLLVIKSIFYFMFQGKLGSGIVLNVGFVELHAQSLIQPSALHDRPGDDVLGITVNASGEISSELGLNRIESLQESRPV